VELEGQSDELVQRERVVDGDALREVRKEAVHGDRVVELALHALEHGAQERRLAIDPTEVARAVVGKAVVQDFVVNLVVSHMGERRAVRPHRMIVQRVVVVAAASDRERLESIDQLTARVLDLETGVGSMTG